MARDLARKAAESAREEEAREAASRRETEAINAARRDQELAADQRRESELIHAIKQHCLRKTLLVWWERAQASTRMREEVQALETQADVFYADHRARQALHQWHASVQHAKDFRRERHELGAQLLEVAGRVHARVVGRGVLCVWRVAMEEGRALEEAERRDREEALRGGVLLVRLSFFWIASYWRAHHSYSSHTIQPHTCNLNSGTGG